MKDNENFDLALQSTKKTEADIREIKRLNKRKTWREFFAWTLVFSLFNFFLLGNDNDIEDISKKRSDELQVIHGTLLVEGNSTRNLRIYVVDDSGNKLRLNLILCMDTYMMTGDISQLTIYRGKSIDVWYSFWKTNRAMVYQMSVNNKVVCGLETANDRVDIVNHDRKTVSLLLYVGMQIFGILMIAIMYHRKYYSRIGKSIC